MMQRKIHGFMICLFFALLWGVPVTVHGAGADTPPEVTGGTVENQAGQGKSKTALEVEVRGVEGALYDNILAHLSIVRQKERQNLTPRIVKRFHAKAEAKIIQAVKPFGYYRPEITATLHHDKETHGWRAAYEVVPGPPLYLKEVTLDITGEALNDPVFEDLLNHFPMKDGDILNQVEYEKSKQRLTILSEERGYFTSKMTRSRITIDEKNYSATIDLAMDTGPRYSLLPVIFKQSAFTDAFLDQFVPFQPGDPYSIDTLLEFRNALDNSDYFSQVNITQNILEESPRVELEVHLEPKRKDLYAVRMGFGTDSQLRLGLDWQRRYFNRLGHRLGGQLSVAQRKNKVAAKFGYTIPSGNTHDDFWEVSLHHHAEDIAYDDLGDLSLYDAPPGGTTRDNNFSFRVSRHRPKSIFGNLLDRFKITETVSLEYLIEYYNLLELLVPEEDLDLVREYVFSDEELKILEPDYRALVPSIQWVYTKADDRAYARQGQQLGLTLKGANKSLGSNFSFFQVHFMNKMIRSLGDVGRFIGRFDAAYTDSQMIDVLELYHDAILPKSLQFSTGGDRSVRGYAYESLNGMGTLVEGRHFLNVSVEYEHPIKDTWSVAAFTDAGNAFNEYSDMELQYGAGLGVRWRSPVGLIGQIRLDIAWALSKDDYPARIHLVIGPDF